jgi:hypothetical protein
MSWAGKYDSHQSWEDCKLGSPDMASQRYINRSSVILTHQVAQMIMAEALVWPNQEHNSTRPSRLFGPIEIEAELDRSVMSWKGQ